MACTTANGITIEYETFGSAADPAVLLIMGLGGQLTMWDAGLCGMLADAGYHVIRYDNRDVGRSTWLDDAPAGLAYTLGDMAADGAGLLDALGIDRAHVVGASMGGMIAQTFALAYPERVLTLTSIMSTTGDPAVGQPTPEAIAILMVPAPTTRDGAIESGLKAWATIGSPGYPFDEAEVARRVGASFDRAFHPSGTARQLAAIMAQPDRTESLRSLRMPTLVLHGDADVLVTPSGGDATAVAVPGARLKRFAGMGHDLPPALHREVADDLVAHFRQA